MNTGYGRLALNLGLLVVLVGLIALHRFLLPDPSQRNWEIFPDMVESIARDAQAPAPAGGWELDWRLPAGSVARGFAPFDYPATEAGAGRAAVELRNPIDAGDDEAIARGALVYQNFCAVCHGAGGLGDGPATRRGVPPPPSLRADKALNMTDGEIYHLITLGRGNMAAYAAQVERDDRWKVIRFLRTLQEGPAPPATVDSTAAEGS